MGRLARLTIALASIVMVPAVALAQASIAGVVKDTSGAVLPGATVEAASPVLIEKTRSVVTDGTGQYKIENLRPGTYSVIFTLAGFNTVKREGIELTGTFTASVNAEMRVGELQETITVTGETPVVDVQNTKQQRVLDRETISAIPSGRDAAIMASLLPGVTTGNQDVGGMQGESGSAAGTMMVHGNRDARTEVNGISVGSTQGSGTTGVGNIAAYQEVQVDTSGVSAEQKEGGVRMNLVPREGGNTFQGYFFGALANSSMQGTNFTDDLKNRGLGAGNTLNKYVDINPAFGGPIKRDKLWFYGTLRYNEASDHSPIFYNLNAGDPNAWTYVADTSRAPAGNDGTWKGANGRITWQATTKNKFSVALDYVDSCQCPRSLAQATAGTNTSTLSPESNIVNHAFLRPKDMLFADWTAPVTNRLLVEASVVRHKEHAFRPYSDIYFTKNSPGPGVVLSAVLEQSNNLTYRAAASPLTDTQNNTFLPRMAVSYISGAHAFKVGFNVGIESQRQYVYSLDSPMSFRFNNGVPNQLTLNATPFNRNIDINDSGMFVQDRWTIDRVTLTGGLRYDYFGTSFPTVTVAPGLLVPNRNITFPATDGVRYHDLEPRTGLAVDVFGNGKTALKVSLNKYLPFLGAPNCCNSPDGTFTVNLAPSALLVNSTTRSWTDANRNFVPDCDLTNPAANAECGAMGSSTFGSTRPGTAYDPATLTGWSKRSYNWQFSTGVQQQLLPRVSMDVSYFRTWFGNFIVTDNRAVGPSDYTQFSLTAPLDPRLPGGGGYPLTGLYDLNPNKVGLVDNYITFSSNFGKQIQHYDGVDINFNVRPRAGLTLQGGASTQRFTTDFCDGAAQVPEALFGLALSGVQFASGSTPSSTVWTPVQYCHQQTPFNTQVRLIGSYTVPRIDVLVSGTVQSLPGPMILANYNAPNAVVAPSLGRNLSANAANISVNLVAPGSMYGERLNQVDFRIGKIFKVGRTRTTASLDLYNVLNANPVLTLNTAFASWQQPQSILNPRFGKVVVQFDF
jgi:hypothetical protein